ncbi:hypothetical protein HG264_03605 [Pseudomonas sp. gcc21]|uniref:alpha/beta hydrolase family esterase n=1 Tax=Pseudomonas sp. gcc21 TaxID=2726989 RepID=UPI0014514B50|nr:alpha/beta hydrolase-fold protein [Pseudomonas sp. gcc21]QJD58056.1 hypothetical protein HG264_03605 [Pseudomonas sp. gcc21]
MTKYKLLYCVALAILATGCSSGDDDDDYETAPDVITEPEPGADPGTDPGTNAGTEPPVTGDPAPADPVDPPPADDPIAEPPPPPTAGPTPAAPSIGCGGPAPQAGSRTIAVGGDDRRYILDLPTGYDPEKAYPVVFSFHGRGDELKGKDNNYKATNGIVETMGEAAIVVHPQGMPVPSAAEYPERRSWETVGSRDVAFFDAMYEELRGEACVDENRVFTMGMSMGGLFASRLACERGDVVRAFSAVASAPPQKSASECVGRAAAWAAHDPQDKLIPYTDGLAQRQYWVDANMCGEETRQLENGCVEYTNCDTGYPVRWCEYSLAEQPNSRNHEWPGFAASQSAAFFQSLD